MRYFIILLCLFAMTVNAQQVDPEYAHLDFNKKAKSSFSQIPLDGLEPVTEIMNYLAGHYANFQDRNTTLQLENIRKSPGGSHFTFHQTYFGIRIFNSQVKVNLDKKGNISSIFDNSYPTKSWPFYLQKGKTDFDENSVAGRVLQNYNMDGRLEKPGKIIVLLPNDSIPIAAVRFNWQAGDQSADLEIIADTKGRIIRINDRRSFSRQTGPDSLVSAKVFLPDPLTSANVVYGNGYRDFNDADIPALNNERMDIQMKVAFSGGVFKLENTYFKMTDIQGPTIDPPVLTSPDFEFTRSEGAFEYVNAFYHLNTLLNHIHQLGFTDMTGWQLQVDAHGDIKDNSFFLSSVPPRVIFGDGGVDDAEDADVIVHEYGHGLSYWAAPNTTTGDERLALDEGFGDYLAASYSRSLNEYNWANVFSWDGHNEFWEGREANTGKFYPDDLVDDIYRDGEIWSSVLMEIWEELGRDATDQLVLQAAYGFAQNMGMRDAALLLLQADEQLNNGANHDVIYLKLFNRGLIQDLETQISGNYGFLHNDGQMTVYLSADAGTASLEVYDLQGRLIQSRKEITDRLFVIPRSWFSANGLYLFRLKTDEGVFLEKGIYIDL
jgi:zinc metalloprotease ZmpB